MYQFLDYFQHINFDVSSLLMVKDDGVIGLSIYDLVVFNGNILPNSAPLRDISPEVWVTWTLPFQGH